MDNLYFALKIIAAIVALLFTFLVFATGKGDAMSGSGGIRTSYKGKASIDDLIGRMTLGFGIAFMVLMLGIGIMAHYLYRGQ